MKQKTGPFQKIEAVAGEGKRGGLTPLTLTLSPHSLGGEGTFLKSYVGGHFYFAKDGDISNLF